MQRTHTHLSSHLILALVLISFLGAPAVCQAQKKSKAKPKIVTTQSGLKYEDIVVGTGASPVKGKNVSFHSIGWLLDGNKFDSSFDRNEPLRVAIGIGRLNKGLDEGIMTMKVGGKRKFIIPPHLGYGDEGFGDLIPPGATIVFEVELLQADQ